MRRYVPHAPPLGDAWHTGLRVGQPARSRRRAPDPRSGEGCIGRSSDIGVVLGHQHRIVCRQLGLKHLFTTPTAPARTARQRFIETLAERWAHGRLHANGAERIAALDAWLYHHNFIRPTAASAASHPAHG